MPHIVVVLVFAQVGEIEAVAAEQRAVVAVQQAVEPAHDRPFEPAQEASGVVRRNATWVSSGFSGADVLHDALHELVGREPSDSAS